MSGNGSLYVRLNCFIIKQGYKFCKTCFLWRYNNFVWKNPFRRSEGFSVTLIIVARDVIELKHSGLKYEITLEKKNDDSILVKVNHRYYKTSLSAYEALLDIISNSTAEKLTVFWRMTEHKARGQSLRASARIISWLFFCLDRLLRSYPSSEHPQKPLTS